MFVMGSLEYVLSKVIVSRRIKSFWFRCLTAFKTQRSRKRKTAQFEDTVGFIGYMVME